MNVGLSRARWFDVLLLWRWRNEARRIMVTTAEIGLWHHLRWFAGVRRDKHWAIYIAWARIDQCVVPVGYVRLQMRRCGGSDYGSEVLRGDVSIVVDPAYRGRGYGAQMLGQVIERSRRLRCDYLDAEIRETNTASRRLFALAGFACVGVGRVGYARYERRTQWC